MAPRTFEFLGQVLNLRLPRLQALLKVQTGLGQLFQVPMSPPFAIDQTVAQAVSKRRIVRVVRAFKRRGQMGLLAIGKVMRPAPVRQFQLVARRHFMLIAHPAVFRENLIAAPLVRQVGIVDPTVFLFHLPQMPAGFSGLRRIIQGGSQQLLTLGSVASNLRIQDLFPQRIVRIF